MPLLLGMFVYREDTSIVSRKWLSGTFTVSSRLRKWAVSLTWLGRACTRGLRVWSTKAEIFSVGLPHAEMIGLPGFLAL